MKKYGKYHVPGLKFVNNINCRPTLTPSPISIYNRFVAYTWCWAGGAEGAWAYALGESVEDVWACVVTGCG